MGKMFKVTALSAVLLYFTFFIPTALAQDVLNTPDNNNTTVPGGTDNTVIPGETDNTVIPGGTDNTVIPGGTDNTVIPDGTDNTVIPGGTNNDINGNDIFDNDDNDVIEDDDDSVLGEVLTYGAGGAIVGSLLTYFAIRGGKRTV